MIYMIGKIGAPQLEQIRKQIPSVGLMLQPMAWMNPCCPYACDNGVYAQWLKGRTWDEGMHIDWTSMLNRLPPDNPPLFVLLPDAVGDWGKTVDLATRYLPGVRRRRLPWAIALQDGCAFSEAAVLRPDYVFVGGTSEWKEQNIEAACAYFKPLNIRVHVGRVNTRRRLVLCQNAGVDSVDGTTLNMFRDASLPLIGGTMAQGSLGI